MRMSNKTLDLCMSGVLNKRSWMVLSHGITCDRLIYAILFKPYLLIEGCFLLDNLSFSN